MSRLPTTIVTALIVVSAGLVGCTWIGLSPDAERVRVVEANSVGECKQVGTTKARTKLRVGIFARSENKTTEELQTLARNDAPELGGNTIVALGSVSADGMQRFAIYDCPVASDSQP